MQYRTVSGEEDIAQALDLYWINEPWAAETEDHSAVLHHWMRMHAECPEGFWVAEDEAGRIVGVATALIRAPQWILANFYVHPDLQGRRIGKTLLEKAMASCENCQRFLVHASTTPAAQALYMQFGMLPLPYSVLFKGSTTDIAASGELEVEEHPVSEILPEINQIDRETLGFTRPSDHLRWSDEAAYYLVKNGENTAGYFRVSTDGILGPLVVTGESWVVPVLDWAIQKQQERSNEPHEIFVPGANRAAIAHLTALRYRFQNLDLLMSSHAMPGLAQVIFHDMDFL